MLIMVNGEAREFEGPQTVTSLLAAAGLGERRLAVEVNGEVVPRSRHASHSLADGDKVELIQAIGGG